MANKIFMTVTKEMVFPPLKEDVDENALRQDLDRLCYKHNCSNMRCDDCVLYTNNFKQLGKEN